MQRQKISKRSSKAGPTCPPWTDLPWPLLETIGRCLSSRDVANCRLVCKDWRDCMAHTTEDVALHAGCFQPDSIAQLERLPALAPAARTVSIYVSRHRAFARPALHGLQMALQGLPKLCSLRLVEFKELFGAMDVNSMNVWQVLSDLWPVIAHKVTTLTVDTGDCPCINDFEVLQKLPALSELHLHQLRLSTRRHIGILGGLTGLRALSFGAAYYLTFDALEGSEFAQAMSPLSRLTGLTSLTLNQTLYGTSTAWGTVLMGLTNLRHLELQDSWFQGVEGLARLKQLRSVCFRFGYDQAAWQAMAQLPMLREVKLLLAINNSPPDLRYIGNPSMGQISSFVAAAQLTSADLYISNGGELDGISRLVSLKRLALRGQELSLAQRGQLLEALNQVPTVRALHCTGVLPLSNQVLTKLAAGCSQLSVLSFAGTITATAAGWEKLQQMTGLKALAIASCGNLKRHPAVNLTLLPSSLQRLGLVGISISCKTNMLRPSGYALRVPAAGPPLKLLQLERLELNSCSAADGAMLEVLAAAGQLTHLHLKHLSSQPSRPSRPSIVFTSDVVRALGRCKRLEIVELHCAPDAVTPAAARALAGLRSLRNLTLRATQEPSGPYRHHACFTDQQVRPLALVTQLRKLDVWYVQHHEAAAELLQALPFCHVVLNVLPQWFVL